MALKSSNMFSSRLISGFFLFATLASYGQDGKQNFIDEHQQVLRRIYDEALVNGKSYPLLRTLSKDIGGRLSGSPEAEKAVNWSAMVMDTLGFDTVYKQSVMVPHWVRGPKEEAAIVLDGRPKPVPICALGGSIGTGDGWLEAEVVEVKGLEELEKLGREKLEGKIVFFNRPMDPRHIYTFHAYGGCVDQRWAGAMEAGKYGAVGVIVRSLSLRIDDYPHTGSMAYEDSIQKIPSAAISTRAAEELSSLLKQKNDVKFKFKQSCETLPDVESFNVIGEIKGTEFPDEIILVGGHLDAWDNGEGAHDDGAGVVHAIEALRILKDLGIRPKRTIRAVMFMNEENGLRGAAKYGEVSKLEGWNHIVAIESDRGGFSPRGFHMEAKPFQIAKVQEWRSMLEPYGIYDFRAGGSGADIKPLQGDNTILVGFIPDSQRYFDHHHSPDDVFENVNKRELEMGAASVAALIYLFDQFGHL